MLALALVCSAAKADKVDISFTGSYGVNLYSLQAQLTVRPAINGTFFEPDGDFYITEVHDDIPTLVEVSNMKGTLNGNPISYTPDPRFPSWGGISGSTFFPGDVEFSSNGLTYSFFVYGSGEILAPFSFDPLVLPDPPPVGTPEPSLLVLLAIGLIGLIVLIAGVKL
jgi:hypothetical protein